MSSPKSPLCQSFRHSHNDDYLPLQQAQASILQNICCDKTIRVAGYIFLASAFIFGGLGLYYKKTDFLITSGVFFSSTLIVVAYLTFTRWRASAA